MSKIQHFFTFLGFLFDDTKLFFHFVSFYGLPEFLSADSKLCYREKDTI